jgi:hypothetical protein
MKKILHIGEVDKFTSPLFFWLAKRIDLSNHTLLARVKKFTWPKECDEVLCFRNGISWVLNFIVQANSADKIIIHGLFDSRIIFLLFLQPWLLKKCYWGIWGGELYAYELDEKTLSWRIKEVFRRVLIARVGFLLTYIDGDVCRARTWYGAKGVHLECLMYPSNTFSEVERKLISDHGVNIQIGNSADPHNNHFEILDKLSFFKDQDIQIYAPLSYGDEAYAESVCKNGTEVFGEKFIGLKKNLPLDQYLSFLNSIDVAVFAHRRQQGMGNIINLLGLGKKVYLRADISSWDVFNKFGIQIYDVSNISLEKIDPDVADENIRIIKQSFSEQALLRQWVDICN